MKMKLICKPFCTWNMFAFSFSVLFACFNAVAMPPSYSIVDLGEVLGKNGNDSTAVAVSNAGHIVGSFLTRQGVRHAVIWEWNPSGQWVATDLGNLSAYDFPPPKGMSRVIEASVWSEARDVNDHGDVVGFCRTFTFRPPKGELELYRFFNDIPPKGVVWKKLKTRKWYFPFRRPRKYKQEERWDIHGINNDSELAYELLTQNNFGVAARESWDSARNGRICNSSPQSCAMGINDPGDVVGYISENNRSHAFLSSREDIGSCDLLPGGEISKAFAVNNQTRIVGWAKESGMNRHAALWFYNYEQNIYQLHDFDHSSALSQTESVAYGINDLTQVVGSRRHLLSLKEFAFMYDFYERQFYSLQDHIQDASDWKVRTAYDINNAGWIVGVGERQGNNRAIVMIPRRQFSIERLDFTPRAINNRGQVIGDTGPAGYPHEFYSEGVWVWENGISTEIDTLTLRQASDINDDQIIVGNHFHQGPGFWKKNINGWEFSRLARGDEKQNKFALGISNSNIVSGYASRYPKYSAGILWQGYIQPWGLPSVIRQEILGGCSVKFIKINASNYVCGLCGDGDIIEWNRRYNMSLIDTPITRRPYVFGAGRVNNINSTGKIVGNFGVQLQVQGYPDLYISKAFLWDPSVGRTIMLDHFPGMVDGWSEAWGINSLGQVVGASSKESFLRQHACLWQKDTGIIFDLNDLLQQNGLDENWELQSAYDINDAGQIVGIGTFRSSGVEEPKKGYILTLPDTW